MPLRDLCFTVRGSGCEKCRWSSERDDVNLLQKFKENSQEDLVLPRHKNEKRPEVSLSRKGLVKLPSQGTTELVLSSRILN